MALTTAATALQILNGSWTAIQNMRERVQASKDNALKISFGGLFDDFNSLRVLVVKLSEENAELLAKWEGQRVQPELRQHGESNYYFVGESGPFCQPCYDKDRALRNLTPRKAFGSHVGRKCLVCQTIFTEEDVPAPSTQVDAYDPYGGNGWMR
jgi:hypothetical protein